MKSPLIEWVGVKQVTAYPRELNPGNTACNDSIPTFSLAKEAMWIYFLKDQITHLPLKRSQYLETH